LFLLPYNFSLGCTSNGETVLALREVKFARFLLLESKPKDDNGPPALIVSFRGTVFNSIRNWVKNLKFTQSKYPYLNLELGKIFKEQKKDPKVHSGFLNVYNMLRDLLWREIMTYIRKNKLTKIDIAFTGHSLGGALATLAAAEFGQYWALTVRLVTFGSPRVGNLVFANMVEQYTSSIQRLVQQNDAVVHLPPQLQGYTHTLGEIWVEGPNRAYHCEQRENPNCSKSIKFVEWTLEHHGFLQNMFTFGVDGCPTPTGLPPTAVSTRLTSPTVVRV
jgi:pimeloyl-ACP methyl ester carboxylesterase